eukprot:scaffold139_cov325-Pavlova_lutheri.AAC.25
MSKTPCDSRFAVSSLFRCFAQQFDGMAFGEETTPSSTFLYLWSSTWMFECNHHPHDPVLVLVGSSLEPFFAITQGWLRSTPSYATQDHAPWPFLPGWPRCR